MAWAARPRPMIQASPRSRRAPPPRRGVRGRPKDSSSNKKRDRDQDPILISVSLIPHPHVNDLLAPPQDRNCGTDGIRIPIQPYVHPLSGVLTTVRRSCSLRCVRAISTIPCWFPCKIVALRADGRAWQEVAATVTLSTSRCRAIHAATRRPVAQPRHDDSPILANLRAFLIAHPAGCRCHDARWPDRLVSPATIEGRFGSWRRAVDLC